MFDPPDFPYKELTESIKVNYDTEGVIYNDTMVNEVATNERDLVQVTEAIISSVENQLTFSSNDNGRFFDVENASLHIDQGNAELNYVIESDNLFNYEPTLLDDNIVNQFLLPNPVPSDANKVNFLVFFFGIFFLSQYTYNMIKIYTKYNFSRCYDIQIPLIWLR